MKIKWKYTGAGGTADEEKLLHQMQGETGKRQIGRWIHNLSAIADSKNGGRKTMKKGVLKRAVVLTMAVMMLGTGMTASAGCAAPNEGSAVTGMTPGGVIIYDYYIGSTMGMPTVAPAYPAVYINAVDAAGITNEMSDMEKCIKVNDYLCSVITYGNNQSFFTDPAWYAEKPNATGEYALVTGNGVCVNYADAFQTMAGMVGVDVGTVASGMMNHAWNEIEIDGVTYYNDVTWNDSLGSTAYLMSPVLWPDHVYPDTLNTTIYGGARVTLGPVVQTGLE